MKKRILIPFVLLLAFFISNPAVTNALIESSPDVTVSDTGIKIKVIYKGLEEKQVPDNYDYKDPDTGKSYSLPLVSSSYSDSVITNRKGTVRAVIDYNWQSYIPKPKEIIEVTYYDEKSGQSIKGEVLFSELILVEKFRWLNDVKAKAVFEVYEAAYYKMKDAEIYLPYNNDFPQIKGHETEIVTAINENIEYFRFTGAKWSGEAYIDSGIKKRDAFFYGERFVAKYAANYLAEWVLPDIPGYDCIALYELALGSLENGNTSSLEKPEAEDKDNSLISDKVKNPVITTTSLLIGIFLLICLVILILVVLKRRRRRDFDDDPLRAA